MSNEKTLTYKGYPIMRKDKLTYLGSMSDSQGTPVATKVSVELQLTDPAVRAKDRIVKKSEKDGYFTALDVGCVWLKRALTQK